MVNFEEKYSIKDILQSKKEHLLLILKIAQKQKQFLEADDVDILMEAIEARQKLIFEIAGLDKYIHDKNLKRDDSYQTPQAQKLHSDIKSILKDIASEDEENIKAAEEKVVEFKHQIRDIKKNKNRIVSYQNLPDIGDGVYIDKKK